MSLHPDVLVLHYFIDSHDPVICPAQAGRTTHTHTHTQRKRERAIGLKTQTHTLSKTHTRIIHSYHSFKTVYRSKRRWGARVHTVTEHV